MESIADEPPEWILGARRGCKVSIAGDTPTNARSLGPLKPDATIQNHPSTLVYARSAPSFFPFFFSFLTAHPVGYTVTLHP